MKGFAHCFEARVRLPALSSASALASISAISFEMASAVCVSSISLKSRLKRIAD